MGGAFQGSTQGCGLPMAFRDSLTALPQDWGFLGSQSLAVSFPPGLVSGIPRLPSCFPETPALSKFPSHRAGT